MDGRVKRPDLDNHEIALAWLEGLSHLDLSVKFDCSPQTISTRLAKARKEFPDLPWDERQIIPGSTASGGSGVKGYLRMNDGRPGESALPRGSIVNGGALRRR
jgi:hypothetical protein